MKTEKLFSYGTLQYENVQLATFGRKLSGSSDFLPGFTHTLIAIKDPEVIAKSGEAQHLMAVYTGNPADRIQGVVFDIDAAELAQADSYEVEDYQRIQVQLASGIYAWVYVSKDMVIPELCTNVVSPVSKMDD